jgi:TPP-dependent pyruvate/acetoin dehydrogenase alpha subunit
MTPTAVFVDTPIRIPATGGEPLAVEQLRELWRRMVWIREHEHLMQRLNNQGLIRGSTHLYVGSEACAVGVVSALSDDDLVLGHYRGHGHALAVGMPPRALIAEVLGRTGGCSGGRGGTKHLMDVSRNHLGSYAIVGQHLPIAVGLALAQKLAAADERRAPSVTVCFFGDGAINQGASMEAINLAAVTSVPCLFVCENNRYAVSSPMEKMVGGESIAGRAGGFGVLAEQVDGMDVLAVRDAALRARAYATENTGPYFLELLTYRYHGHSVFQVDDTYRTAEEVDSWRQRDPIDALEKILIEAAASGGELAAERRAIEATLADAAEWARDQPLPGAVSEEDMYASNVGGLDSWGSAL